MWAERHGGPLGHEWSEQSRTTRCSLKPLVQPVLQTSISWEEGKSRVNSQVIVEEARKRIWWKLWVISLGTEHYEQLLFLLAIVAINEKWTLSTAHYEVVSAVYHKGQGALHYLKRNLKLFFYMCVRVEVDVFVCADACLRMHAGSYFHLSVGREEYRPVAFILLSILCYTGWMKSALLKMSDWLTDIKLHKNNTFIKKTRKEQVKQLKCGVWFHMSQRLRAD